MSDPKITQQNEAANVPGGFSLDESAVLPAKLRNFFKMKLADYGPVYGVKERAVKQWVSNGRKATPPDLPPLDNPNEMPAWWGRRMKQAVPSNILQAASGAKKAPVRDPDRKSVV